MAWVNTRLAKGKLTHAGGETAERAHPHTVRVHWPPRGGDRGTAPEQHGHERDGRRRPLKRGEVLRG